MVAIALPRSGRYRYKESTSLGYYLKQDFLLLVLQEFSKMNIHSVILALNLLFSLNKCSAFPRQSKSGLLELELKRMPVEEKFIKRDGSARELDLYNRAYSGLLNVIISIGKEGQDMFFVADTGLSDTWVVGQNSVYCDIENGTTPANHTANISENTFAFKNHAFPCYLADVFEVDYSTSIVSNNTDFFTQFYDYTFASGTWYQDTIETVSIIIEKFNFGVAQETNATIGSLGLGLEGNEITNEGDYAYTYENFPTKLKNSGMIKRVIYSIYAGKIDTEDGSLLFGAVEHSRYVGDTLYTLPLVNVNNASGDPAEFHVTLQNLVVSVNKTNTTITSDRYAALLNTGAIVTYLPTNLFSDFIKKIGLSESQKYYGMYITDCSSGISFSYDFGGFKIESSLNDYLFEIDESEIPGAKCAVTINSHDEKYLVLGSGFFSSAYVVFDLERLEVSIAQAAHVYDNFTYSNIEDNPSVEIVIDSIPSATKAASYSNTWAFDRAPENRNSHDSSTFHLNGESDIGALFNSVTDTSSSSQASSNIGCTDSSSSAFTFFCILVFCVI